MENSEIKQGKPFLYYSDDTRIFSEKPFGRTTTVFKTLHITTTKPPPASTTTKVSTSTEKKESTITPDPGVGSFSENSKIVRDENKDDELEDEIIMYKPKEQSEFWWDNFPGKF